MVAPKRDPDMNERANIQPGGTGFNDMRHKGRFSGFAVRFRELSAVSYQPSAGKGNILAGLRNVEREIEMKSGLHSAAMTILTEPMQEPTS